MSRIKIALILMLISLKGLCQMRFGQVIDSETHEEIPFATIRFAFQDNTQLEVVSDVNGRFQFKPKKGRVIIITSALSYATDTLLVDKINKDKLILKLDDLSVPFCILPEETKYVCEENDPSLVYYRKGIATENFTDSLNRKQGLWYYVEKDKYERKTKYQYNQLISTGYYNNGVREGRWLFFTPKFKLDKVIVYRNGVIISKLNKCIAE